MKLVSWNVNGFRAVLKKDFMESFKKLDADIFCMQETKMQVGQAEFDLGDVLFHEFWNSAVKKGYSGTAVFSKLKPLAVANGMDVDRHDQEGRIITAEYEDFYLVNVYTPNSQSELQRLDYRMHWEDDFRDFLISLDAKKPVVICGDLNCAHQEIDLKNPKTNTRNAGFTIEERGKLTALLDSGFTDVYRSLYPDKHDAYTWWSYMRNAREKNTGWRIDYFLVSDRLMRNVKDATIYPDIYGSDHCPVALFLDFSQKV
jgi:exodeoxyribonuclease-3